MRSLLALLFLTYLLAACSHTQTDSKMGEELLNTFLIEEELQLSGSTDRIVNFTIDSWKYVNPYHIMIKTRRDDQYLVSLRTYCRGLDTVLVIGTTGTTGSLTKFDNIIFKDSFSGRENCSIKDIIKLEPVSSNSE